MISFLHDVMWVAFVSSSAELFLINAAAFSRQGSSTERSHKHLKKAGDYWSIGYGQDQRLTQFRELRDEQPMNP